MTNGKWFYPDLPLRENTLYPSSSDKYGLPSLWDRMSFANSLLIISSVKLENALYTICVKGE